jgi:spore coat protein U-like protein
MKAVLEKLPLFICSLLSVGFASSPAGAATTIANFGVTATVQAMCLMSATTKKFGAYNQAVTNATSTVSVTCTNSTLYSVSFSADAVRNGTETVEQISSFTSDLPGYWYSARNTNRAQTIDLDSVAGAGDSPVRLIPIHGPSPSSTFVIPGPSSKTITAIVTY